MMATLAFNDSVYENFQFLWNEALRFSIAGWLAWKDRLATMVNLDICRFQCGVG